MPDKRTQDSGQSINALIVGQIPPPYGGQAIMIQHLLESDQLEVNLKHVSMNINEAIGNAGKLDYRKVWPVARILRDILLARLKRPRPDIVYYPPSGATRASLYRDLVLIGVIRTLFPRIIYHFHASGLSESFTQRNRLEQWLIRRVYFRPDAAILLSPLQPDEAKFVEAKRTFIVPNGIPDPALARLEPSPTTCPNILFVGIVGEAKGALRLLDAAAQLRDQGLAFCVTLMGDMDHHLGQAGLQDLIRDRGLQDRVQFIGVKTGAAKDEVFAAADILCFPSLFAHETFPLVLIEAQAHALPVVTSNWRAIPDIVTHDVDGFLARDASVDETAAYLRRLIQSEQLRLTMGRAARRNFETRFQLGPFQERVIKAIADTARGVETS